MTNTIIPFPDRRRTPPLPSFPAWACPATRERVVAALEAADEAEMAGLPSLADRLIEAARAEVVGLRARMAA